MLPSRREDPDDAVQKERGDAPRPKVEQAPHEEHDELDEKVSPVWPNVEEVGQISAKFGPKSSSGESGCFPAGDGYTALRQIDPPPPRRALTIFYIPLPLYFSLSLSLCTFVLILIFISVSLPLSHTNSARARKRASVYAYVRV